MTYTDPIQNVSGGEILEVMADAHNYNDYLKELVRQHAGDANTALDFGAGIGTFSDATGIDRKQVFCIEPNQQSQLVLREAGYQVGTSLDEIPDQSISYAFSLNVLEHIDDDVRILNELNRVLIPGGHLFIYVPAFMVLFTSMDKHVGHVRRYKMRELQEKISDAGFDLKRSAYADFLGFFAALVYRIVDDGEPKPLKPSSVWIYDRMIFPISKLLSIPFAKILGKNVYVLAKKKNQP